jgi:TRAP-type mannitol/chloroaromatic compound transport system permease small subunit
MQSDDPEAGMPALVNTVYQSLRKAVTVVNDWTGAGDGTEPLRLSAGKTLDVVPERRVLVRQREEEAMSALLALTRAIDALSRWFSIIAIFLVLAASMTSAFNAMFRYSMNGIRSIETLVGGGFFGGIIDIYRQNSNTLSEAQWYMFAAMVMLGGAWTLKVNEHVRVDLFYGMVSERTRTWIDLLGGIFFLLPICVLMIYFTWPWFVQSWTINETSPNAGGLLRWPVKLVIPVGFFLVGLQGVSEIIKCILALTTDYVREFAYEKPLQ